MQVNKKEKDGNIYSELPLLRIEVTDDKVDLIALTNINVYNNAFSLPIKVSPSEIPTSPEKFDILWTGGEIPGLTTVNLQQQFTLSLQKTA